MLWAEIRSSKPTYPSGRLFVRWQPDEAVTSRSRGAKLRKARARSAVSAVALTMKVTVDPVDKGPHVAKVGRNDPCPCGSGLKAKRCCGTPRGPSEATLASAYVAAAARDAAADLVGLDHLDELELSTFLHEIVHLPELDLSLHVPLPRLLPPPLQRLCYVLETEDLDAFDGALPEAVAIVDGAAVRASLTRSVARLRDDGLIARDVAAVALVDLTMQRSVLLVGSLIQALAVSVGAACTPAGLHVARTSSDTGTQARTSAVTTTDWAVS
jgi:hypothetical protein